MKRSRGLRTSTILILFGAAILLVTLAGAGYFLLNIPPIDEQLPPGSSPLAVSIARPLAGQQVPGGESVEIQSAAVGAYPLTAFQLWINGIPVETKQAGGTSQTASTIFTWTPGAYGDYVLMVRATDALGYTGQSSPLPVRVAAAQNPPGLFDISAEEGDTLTTLSADFDLLPEQLGQSNPGLGLTDPLPPDAPITIPLPFDPQPVDGPTGPFAPTMLTPPEPPLIPAGTGQEGAAPSGLGNIPFWLGAQFGSASLKLPDAPEIMAKSDACNVRLTIIDKSDGETGFFVYRLAPGDFDFTRIATLGSGGDAPLIFSSDTPPAGTSQYYVSAFNAKGESPSGIAVVEVADSACAQPDQQVIVFAHPLLAVRQPVDKLYCYTRFGDSRWDRLPAKVDTFITPLNDQADLSPYLGGLGAAGGDASFGLECWGWNGGALLSLGAIDQSLATTAAGPVTLQAQDFSLSAALSKPAFLPNLAQSGDIPDMLPPQISPDIPDQVINRPIAPALTFSTETGEGLLTWSWNPTDCFPPAAGEPAPPCPYVSDIEGFWVYDQHGELVVTADYTGTPHSSAVIPPTQTDNILDNLCYTVTAHKNTLISPHSDPACAWEPVVKPKPGSSDDVGFVINVQHAADAVSCVSHFPSGAGKLISSLICQPAIGAKQVVITWDWQAWNPEKIARPDGYNVYAMVYGEAFLVQTVTNPDQHVAILPKPDITYLNAKCWVIRAYVGGLEGQDSEELCVSLDDLGVTDHITLIPSWAASYTRIYHWHEAEGTCLKSKNNLHFTGQLVSFAEAGSVTEYHSFNTIACDKHITMWTAGHVKFPLDDLLEKTIVKAVLTFDAKGVSQGPAGPVTTAGVSQGEHPLHDMPFVPTSCVRRIGYSTGTYKPVEKGDSEVFVQTGIFYADTVPVGVQEVDVTAIVQESLAAGNAIFGVIVHPAQAGDSSENYICSGGLHTMTLEITFGK